MLSWPRIAVAPTRENPVAMQVAAGVLLAALRESDIGKGML